MFQFYMEEKGERNHNSVYLREWMWAQWALRQEKQGPASHVLQEHSWKPSSTHVSSSLLQKRSFSKCLVRQRRSQNIFRTLNSSPLPSPIPMPALAAAFWVGNATLSPHHSAKPSLLTGFGALRPKGKMLKILLCSASFCFEQQVPDFQWLSLKGEFSSMKAFIRFNTFRTHTKCKHISTQLVSTFDKKFASC